MNDFELGEWIADFENRISYLENLHTPSTASLNNPIKEEPESIETPLPPPYQKLLERIDQLQGMLLNTREKLQQLLKEKPTKKHRY